MKPSIPPVLITFALGCFALVQNTQAVNPPPDGGYPGGNTAEGQNALFSLTGSAAVHNTAVGDSALHDNRSADNNTATGYFTLRSNTGGKENTATGALALANNTFGRDNSANGFQALLKNTTGNNNTATGSTVLERNITGNNNTATGVAALHDNTTGVSNTATGYQALFNNTIGDFNTATGVLALANNTTGTHNTAFGYHALFNNDGMNNIAIGASAGNNLTTGSNNICIDNLGEAGESNTIRIGTQQTTTFIKGISGSVVTGAAVVVNAAGRLGTAPSSYRFKKEIRSMNTSSEAILALKPVTFHYKSDQTGTPQYGLIAEEVAKVNPDLVVRDEQGKPYTVRYDAVNAMLLNEFLKEHRKNEEQEKTIAQLKSGMTALAATVKEQGAQIQKVSAQLEASKSAPQVVNNP